MGKAIGETLPLAIGVAVSPVPIIAIVLMLGTPRARSTGVAFAVGWVAGLTAVGTITLLIAGGNAGSTGKPATWVDVMKLVFGLLFLLLAFANWRKRPRPGREAPMPGWMKAIDRFTTGRSLIFGVILSAANPKNLALTIAAAAVIAQAGISGGQEAVSLAIFVLVGSVTIVAPLLIYLAMGAKAKAILDGLKTWMGANNATIMAVLLLVLGSKLIGDAISGFSA
jgi:threonine/homoserine/homoserine lactone efflux protein